MQTVPRIALNFNEVQMIEIRYAQYRGDQHTVLLYLKGTGKVLFNNVMADELAAWERCADNFDEYCLDLNRPRW
jgi:hypothetical protein